MNKITIKLAETICPEEQNAYENLCLNFTQIVGDLKYIEFMSCQEQEGKTMVSLVLAKWLGMMGKKILWIDADLRKESSNRIYDTEAVEDDLLTYLKSNDLQVDKVIYETTTNNLWVIPNIENDPDAYSYMGTERMKELLSRVEKSYDFVFLDTPAGNVVSDPLLLAELCDGIVLIVEDEKIKLMELDKLVEKVNQSGCKILGTVLNKVKQTSSKKRKLKKFYGKRK